MKRGRIFGLMFFMSVFLVSVVAWAKPPTPTGDLTVALPNLGREMWIHSLAGSADEMNQLGFTNEYLFYRPEGDQTIGPGLAEKWKVFKDGLTYDIYLRKGIQFHDGWGEFTADDVKFTIEHMMGQGSLHVMAGMFRRAIESIEVVNRYHVRVKCKAPTVDLLYNLADFYSYVPMLSKKYVETVGVDAAGKRPIGTGPWKFVEHKVGEYVKYEGVENHWRKTPEFKTLTTKVVPEEAMRVAMLKAKEVDIIPIDLASKKEIVAAGLKILRGRGGTSQAVLLGGQVLPTRKKYDPTVPWVDGDNPERALKVRKALTLAINKGKIVEYILAGEGEPIEVWGYPRGSVFSDPKWKPHPYDPEQARKLLAEAGYAKGFTINMKYFVMGGRPEIPAIGEAVAMDWENIGLTVKRELTEYAVVKPKWAARDSAWEVWIYGQMTFPEGWMAMHFTMNSGDMTNNYGFETPKLDEYLKKIVSTMDFKERVKLSRELGSYIYNNYYIIGACQKNIVYGGGPRVGDWTQAEGNARPNRFEYVTHAR